MFIITVPSNFAVGQTLPARINGRDRQVTYRDADTLIIEANGDQPAQTKLISWIEPAGKIKGVPASMFWAGTLTAWPANESW